MLACISSNVLFFVSGTIFATKSTVRAQIAAYNPNVPVELQLIMKLKVKETTHAPNQFTSTTRLPATPLTFIGNICRGRRNAHMTEPIIRIFFVWTRNVWLGLGIHTSDIITQGTAPIPIENAAMYVCNELENQIRIRKHNVVVLKFHFIYASLGLGMYQYSRDGN